MHSAELESSPTKDHQKRYHAYGLVSFLYFADFVMSCGNNVLIDLFDRAAKEVQSIHANKDNTGGIRLIIFYIIFSF